MLERILREAGVPELIDVLVERLAPTDLQSLLLESYRRRVVAVKPSQLLERYEHAYTPVELSPVCPLGTNAAVATVDQNNVVTTIRNTEVVADATNVLALECASRRRRLLRADPRNRERVRLCTSHRVVRGQAYSIPGALPHFRLLGLCVAGRDEGSFQFETTSLVEQIAFYLRLLREATHLGYPVHGMRVAITDLEQGRREQALNVQVLEPLATNYPGVRCELDPDRETGRGYYVGVCFVIPKKGCSSVASALNASAASFALRLQGAISVRSSAKTVARSPCPPVLARRTERNTPQFS